MKEWSSWQAIIKKWIESDNQELLKKWKYMMIENGYDSTQIYSLINVAQIKVSFKLYQKRSWQNEN